jgi:SMODS and SLOG-associating 2TM effector domain 2
MPKNIEPTISETDVWSAENSRAQLNKLHDQVVTQTSAAIAWYLDKKRWPAHISRTCRFVGVGLLVLGGLCPVLKSAFPTYKFFGVLPLSDAGYLLLAMSGAAILIDKLGNFSAAWMRYITTHLQLNGMLEEFQFEWQIASAQYDLKTGEKDVIPLITMLRDFSAKVSAVVNQETQQWLSEFRATLAVLEKASDAKKDEPSAKPSTVVLPSAPSLPVKSGPSAASSS